MYTPLNLTANERRRHVYLVGKTGTGKTTLIESMVLSDLETGRGFALLDPHGDLALKVADCIPPSRTNQAIYLDPLDPDYAVAFNPLESVPLSLRATATANIVSAFKNIWSDTWGARLEYLLLNSVRLLMDIKGATLLHIPVLLIHDQYRTKLLQRATDPHNAFFWREEFSEYTDRYRAEAMAPLQNKAGQFAATPALRAILGQPKSTLDIARIINEGRILIANLSKRMGEAPSHLLGALLTSAFAQAAESRHTISESERRDFTFYADEFQNFATDSFSTILSEARKWRLNLVIANQFLSQLPIPIQDAVLGNVGTLMAFRVGSRDARRLAEELGIENYLALTDTSNFSAWSRLVRYGTPGDALPINTARPKAAHTGRFTPVRNFTRALFSRPRRHAEQTAARIFDRT